MLIIVIIRHSGADGNVRRCRPVIAERLEPNKTTAKSVGLHLSFLLRSEPVFVKV